MFSFKNAVDNVSHARRGERPLLGNRGRLTRLHVGEATSIDVGARLWAS